MIETAIVTALKVDVALASLVSTFSGSPAIFANEAPESAIEPYITLRLSRSTVDSSVQEFTLYVDFWDYNESRVNSRIAAERVEFLLDNKSFETERYSDVRCWFFSGGDVSDQDTRAIHHNLQFSIRAIRKKWMATIT